MERKDWLVSDWHGCLARKRVGRGLYIQEGLSREQYNQLTSSLPEIGVRHVLHPLSPNRHLSGLSDEWTRVEGEIGLDFDPQSTDPDPAAQKPTSVGNKVQHMLVHNVQYFENFAINSSERDALANLHEIGYKITIISALPACCSDSFISLLTQNRLWSHLRGDFLPAVIRDPAIENPLLAKSVGYRVFTEVAVAEGSRVVGFEDDYNIAKFLAAFFNLEIHLPFSETEAKKQGEIELPNNLNKHNTNGMIIFNSNLDKFLASLHKDI